MTDQQTTGRPTLELLEYTRADGAAVAAAVEVENAAGAVDSPWSHPTTVASHRAVMRWGWDQEPGRYFLARSGDVAVAHGVLWTSEWDNRDLAWFDLVVHPAHRRAGHGSRLLRHLEGVAADMGRTKVGADAWDTEPGRAFAAHHGFTLGSQAIARRQHLDRLDLPTVRARHAEAAARAAEYELVRVPGRTPEPLLPAVAEMTAAINDAPTDDLDVEDEVYPAERVRRYEEAQEGCDRRLYRLLARHRDTGELAGHTVVAVEAERPEIGHQEDTSVVRAHRGHRLGFLLKSGMLLWLADEEPQLATVDTWNAESNDHMIAVNSELGYAWMGRVLQFQRPLTR